MPKLSPQTPLRPVIRLRASRSYGLVLVLITVALLLAQAGPEQTLLRLLAVAAQVAALVVAAWTSRSREGRFLEAFALLLLMLIAVAVSIWVGGDTAKGITHLVGALAAALALGVISLGVGRSISEQRTVTLQAVFGVVSIYLLVGMFFAFLGSAVGNFESGAFFNNGTAGSLQDHVYFSLTTLTTTGYGDLAPLSSAARTLSVTEALLGQLYLVTVVAVIVANLGRGPGGPIARRRRGGDPEV